MPPRTSEGRMRPCWRKPIIQTRIAHAIHVLHHVLVHEVLLVLGCWVLLVRVHLLLLWGILHLRVRLLESKCSTSRQFMRPLRLSHLRSQFFDRLQSVLGTHPITEGMVVDLIVQRHISKVRARTRQHLLLR